MEDIRIKFVDFWEKFDPADNYFYRILSRRYNVIISDDPEILFYSCYSSEHVKYKCIRIFYSGENVRPDFNACDFAMTFDYHNNPNHFRLPLYLLYMERLALLKGMGLTVPSREEAIELWKRKTKFCCIVVSNPKAKERIELFEALTKEKKVDSGGRYLNNIGAPVEDKMEFIRDYKFVISFENSSHDGYTTEKILEPLYAGCIPVYWGNRLVEKEINGRRIINKHNFRDNRQLIQKIMEVDQDDELAINMLCEPFFAGSKDGIPPAEKGIDAFLFNIVSNRKKIIPNATTYREYIHKANNLVTKIIFRIKNPFYKPAS